MGGCFRGLSARFFDENSKPMSAMKKYTFPKPEHLCHQKDIEELFGAGGRSSVAYPLRVVWRTFEYRGGPRVKVLLSVSKRKLRHAVDRNRAKRQLREAYRLQKSLLLSALPQDMGMHVAFLWLSSQPEPSSLLHARVGALLQRMGEKCGRKEPVSAEVKE